MTTKQSILMGVALGLAITVGRVIERESARQSTAPVALAPHADTTVVYRTILVGPPRPDTTLRYECKETK